MTTSGADELLQLAHLLRVGANLLRDITVPCATDSQMLQSMADQAGVIADRLDGIAGRARNGGAMAH